MLMPIYRQELPPVAFLESVFAYNQDTGTVTFKPRAALPKQWWNKRAGKVNGDGYLQTAILIDGVERRFLVHRIVWKLLYGVDPDIMDHINGNRIDNRIVNLRSCSDAENARNKRGKLGRILPKGVYPYNGSKRFYAMIMKAGRKINLGSFDSQSDAQSAYDIAAKELHGEFAR